MFDRDRLLADLRDCSYVFEIVGIVFRAVAQFESAVKGLGSVHMVGHRSENSDTRFCNLRIVRALRVCRLILAAIKDSRFRLNVFNFCNVFHEYDYNA